ncbi:zinc finger MYM-type protein 1-like [Rosa chinensis]|uniref:zinc finger MYM-type protein 1-like n=1 Tax=Rosa chinensis TaxID=74649 RepID=UPI001AD9048F|nr:zinc finger MYM-type protein 1-like [Rosa chinensis]
MVLIMSEEATHNKTETIKEKATTLQRTDLKESGCVVAMDGAFQLGNGKGGIGVIERNEVGAVKAAWSRYIPNLGSALHAEAEACRAGLLLAIHQSWMEVDMESDSSILVAALNQSSDNNSEFWVLHFCSSLDLNLFLLCKCAIVVGLIDYLISILKQHTAFIVDGFKAWKRVCGGDNVLTKHSKSSKDIEDNRLRLKASIESVRLLANQGAAFRGHDETENSLNEGYFREVIKSFSRMSIEVERVVLGNAPGNAKYISPSIQKQLLNILGNKVRNKIREEVGDSKYCILVDEAVDISSKEQITIILRFVDCQDEISKVLTMYNLQVRNMRGQGYDGASNMRGIYNGLQALFLEECPYAYYVHCFAHRLQLSLNATTKGVPEIWPFFSTLSLIVNFVDSSAKRHSVLKAVRKEEIAYLVACGQLQTGTGANQVCTLQRAAATRWSSHFRSIKSLIELFSSTKKTLNYMIEQGPLELQGEVVAVLKAMRSFDLVFCLLLMHKLMKITKVLCQTLQRKSLDFVHAMKFVGHTKSFLQEIREEGWDDLVRNVETFCEKHDIDMPDMNARYKDGTGRRCQQRDFITVEHHYHIDVFNALVDFQLSELNRRFSDQTSKLLILSSTLDPRDNFINFKTEGACNLAKKYYPEDFVDSEMFALELECAYYEKDMRSDPKFQNLESISDLCRMLVQTKKSEFFPMLYKLICLVLTISVSTATTERVFSVMNIIKNKLRNMMEDEFLGDCMVLHIEKEYAEFIDNESVIKEFEACGTRRVRFS